MSGTPRIDRQQAQHLMMAALDDELLDDELEHLQRLLEDRPELEDEWRRLSQAKSAAARLVLREPPREIWDVYWQSVFNRLERSASWVLCLLGAGGLGAYALARGAAFVATDARLPALAKLLILGLVGGALWLVLSVLREKWTVERRDPYRHVRR